MKIKEIRILTGLSQSKFCEKFGIPLPTLRKWEQGHRTCPDYVAELLEFKIKEDLKMGKMISMSTIDRMGDLKRELKDVSARKVEDIIKNLTDEEKDCLLRLYIYGDIETAAD